MRGVPLLRTALLQVGLLIAAPALCADAPPAAAAEAPVTFRIAAGPLPAALQQWAQRSGRVLLFDRSELAGLRTAGVQGAQTADAALAHLLYDQPVDVRRTATGSYVLRRQRRPPAVAPPPAASLPAVKPAAAPQVELAPVHVTGSRLPRTPVQSTLPVQVIERDEILRSGYGSLFDLLRHVPGMNGQTPLGTSRGGDSLYLPVGAAATTSLDGMGPRATLFLVNGRRLPRYPMLSLLDGALTDLGGIPLSFVERIELVRGGASAIYGADALSGVVNILLRDQAERPEAMLQAGTSTRGDGQQYRLQAATGGTRAQGDRWFAGLDLYRTEHVAGHRRRWHADRERYPIGLLLDNGDYYPATRCAPPLREEEDGCWYDPVRPRSLQPATDTVAAYARYRHDRGEGRYAYAEARGSDARQRFELGATAVALQFDRTALLNVVLQEGGQVRPRVQARDIDLTVGVGRVQPGRQWEASLSAQRSEVRMATAGVVRSGELLEAASTLDFLPGFSSLPAGVADTLFPTIRSRGRTAQWQGGWGVQRSVAELPGGTAQLATGIELRNEHWTWLPDPLLGRGELALGLPLDHRQRTRTSRAGYAELGLPVAPSLHVDLAARLDRDAGDTAFSPRMGLRWTPAPGWAFTLSSGRGFRAPSLYEQRRPPAYFEQAVLPAASALPPCAQTLTDGSCVVGVEVAESTGLRPETSRSHSLGAYWTPTDALSLSISHTIVELRNEILALQPADAAWNRQTWVLDDQQRLRDVQLSFDNIGRTRSRNWVLRGTYQVGDAQAARGQWTLGVDALVQQELRRERRHEPAVDLRGHATPQRAGVMTAQWQNRRWDVALRGNYVGRTRAWLPGAACTAEQRARKQCMNPSQLRWNLHLARQLGPRVSMALAVNNLLDASPVNHLPGNGGYAQGLDDPLGRYLLLTLQVH